MMDLNDPTIIQEFIEESNEHLADVEAQLLEIEQAGANIDVELVNTVFRAVHSVKGTAGFLGLETIQQLAHVLENVLNLVRNRELVPDGKNIEVMLRAADDLRNLINDIENSNSVDVSTRVTALLAIANDVTARELAADTPSTDATLPHAPAAPEIAAVASPPVAAPVPSTSPPESPPAASSPPSVTAAVTPPAAVAVAPPVPVIGSDKPAAQEAERSGERHAPQGETSIRVPVATLDLLMNLAGELVLRRNCLLQLNVRREDNELSSVAASVDQVTSRLQEAIMQTRMQAIGNVFSRFPRVVRDLNGKLGKQCEIVLEGKSVEVDKSILEAIADPLTHLVRNAIDHGLESNADRAAAGKTDPAALTLTAYHQAGRVCIDVSDNGRGIDPVKIKEKAVSKQILTAEAAADLSDREAMRLIFAPGFSTAAAVTDISGRGVGMDVVRTNIEKLGGTVDVESVVGAGTTIRIALPLTLAIIPSLIVVCAGRRFAVPQVNILELVRVSPKDVTSRIGHVKSAKVLRLRGDLLPLVCLREVLNLPEMTPDATDEANGQVRPTNIIVVEAGTSRFGLIVDDLRDSEEIVVKPLGTHIKGCKALDAATILGDGQIAWILSPAGIASMASLHLSQEDQTGYRRIDAEGITEFDRQQVLTFTNNGEQWFGVPMDVILRIDRIDTQKITHVGSREMIQQNSRMLPLIRLENSIQALPGTPHRRANVIVFEMFEREIGLLAEKIQDIRVLQSDMDVVTCVEQGVIGSFLENGQTVRLLDVYQVARKQAPEWFQQPSNTTGAGQTILVVEDSTFFRNQISRFLEEQKYKIILAEHGKQAWEILTADTGTISLIVTDIEMPHMTGLELCDRIRKHDRLKHLPVIVMSSLGSDADIERGLSVGVNEYHVKFNQDKLLGGVRRLLSRRPGKASTES